MHEHPYLNLVRSKRSGDRLVDMAGTLELMRQDLAGLPIDVALVMDKATGLPMVELSELSNGQLISSFPASEIPQRIQKRLQQA